MIQEAIISEVAQERYTNGIIFWLQCEPGKVDYYKKFKFEEIETAEKGGYCFMYNNDYFKTK